MRLDSLSVARVAQSARFEISLAGAFNLQGYGELDAQNIPLTLRSEVEFGGVVVAPGNVLPVPAALADVVRLVEPFMNLSNLGDPECDLFRYVLKAEVRRT